MTLHNFAKSVYKVVTADWFWATFIVVGAFIVPAPESGAATVLGLPKLCIFRNITGIVCPGCGMTRSLIATGHLHFDDAFTFHPLGPPVFLLLFVYAVLSLTRIGSSMTVHMYHALIPRIVPILLVFTFAIVWLLRLFGYLPTPG